MKKILLILTILLISAKGFAFDFASIPNTFVSRQIIRASQVNANWSALLNGMIDATKKINVAEVWVNGSRVIENDLDINGKIANLTSDLNVSGNADIDFIRIESYEISTTSGDMTITPVSGNQLILDGHYEFDGATINSLTDNNSVLRAYAGKTIDIEGVEFDANTASDLNTISSATSASLNITPGSGAAVIIDSHFGFDGATINCLTDNNTTINAYAGKDVVIEDVTFDGGDVGNVGTLTATTLAGTLSTAAQGSVTSLGTLTGLRVDGAISVGRTATKLLDVYSASEFTEQIIESSSSVQGAGLTITNDDNKSISLSCFGSTNGGSYHSLAYANATRLIASANELLLAAVSTVNIGTGGIIEMKISPTGEVFMPSIYNDDLAGGSGPIAVIMTDDGQLGYSSSALKFKTNVEDMENINWLYNLRPVNFNYRKQIKVKSPTSNVITKEFSNEFNPKKEYGLIADEVVEIAPEFVFYDKVGELKGVQYRYFISVLIKAVQDQNKLINALDVRIKSLESI